MKDFGGMVSFTFKSGKKEDAVKFLEKVRVFTLAESLGGVESLANHPALMTHASIPAEKRAELGITDDLVRLSVGIEGCGRSDRRSGKSIFLNKFSASVFTADVDF